MTSVVCDGHTSEDLVTLCSFEVSAKKLKFDLLLVTFPASRFGLLAAQGRPLVGTDQSCQMPELHKIQFDRSCLLKKLQVSSAAIVPPSGTD